MQNTGTIIKLSLLLSFVFLFTQCASNKKNAAVHKQVLSYKLDTLTLVDQSRNREIPVAIYQPENEKNLNKIPIIFNHGYGGNKGGDYLIYSYLTTFLASEGYFVMSIQHELPTDELLAMTGKLQETRRPNWGSGAKNIYSVLQQIKTSYPDLLYNKLVVIGHSNGGDMAALFTQQYPTLVHKIITMDNRRMALPRTSAPQVFTLRSNDYPADDGVLPTDEDAKKYKMTVQFTNINHSNMDDDATTAERSYITEKILAYLKQ